MTTTTATMEKQGSGAKLQYNMDYFRRHRGDNCFRDLFILPNVSQAVYANTLRQSTPLILGAFAA